MAWLYFEYSLELLKDTVLQVDLHKKCQLKEDFTFEKEDDVVREIKR